MPLSGKINTVITTVLSKLIRELNGIPINISIEFDVV